MILISNKDTRTRFQTLSSQIRINKLCAYLLPVWTTGKKASDSGSTAMYKITEVFTLIELQMLV